ncbi:MAG: threonine--tRNA ligase [Candidatus Pacebacteria bacterium]|nr:threonine--tRNA ligase [Candidatus Paceibacterota bacterium]
MKQNSLEKIRHSLAHILALAIKNLYPEAKFGVGPVIENGFYYDIEIRKSLSLEDLPKIEKEMKNIIKQEIPFRKKIVSLDEARRIFKGLKQPYKIELLKDLEKYGTTEQDEIRQLAGKINPSFGAKSKKIKKVSIYQVGDFVDLCRGPHVKNTRDLPSSFKLIKVSGAYWRGEETNPMLQRIMGLAFLNEKELSSYLAQIEEAEKRDHRVLGKNLELFSFHDEGVGFPFFHPKGMILRNILEDYWKKEHQKSGYEEVKTPILLSKSLWMQSGHWDHYKENMYFTKIDNKDYAIKPMNCPGGILIYKSSLHSYRDLPLRMAELGLVHRHELSGVLQGLFRVRSFTQDDAHIFMTPEQVTEEIKKVIDLTARIYKKFGFSYHVELSTKPKNAMGSDDVWQKATKSLKQSLKEKKLDFIINKGEGAFYGPKIDFHLKDCLGRTWQCGTIQLDFVMPEKFDLFYIDKKGKKQRPVMLHRTILGSIERFIGILTENYGGEFPLWLAPVQVAVLPIREKNVPFAKKVSETIRENNFRTELWSGEDTLSKKIKKAEEQKIPYILVIGDQEEKSRKVAVRKRKKGDIGKMTISKFSAMLLKEL